VCCPPPAHLPPGSRKNKAARRPTWPKPFQIACCSTSLFFCPHYKKKRLPQKSRFVIQYIRKGLQFGAGVRHLLYRLQKFFYHWRWLWGVQQPKGNGVAPI